MSKKDRELQILKKIYNSDKISIKEHEQPDFVLQADNVTFGAEITEFYLNESVARLINYPGYKERILNSKDNSVLDKNDVGVLSRHEMYILDKTDDKYKFLFDFVAVKYDDNMNFNSKPSYEYIENKIIEIINTKNEKSKEYDTFDYNELIIQSMEMISEEYINKLSLSEKILDSVDKSSFKRMYLLIGKYLCVYGQNLRENLDLYNVGGDSNE